MNVAAVDSAAAFANVTVAPVGPACFDHAVVSGEGPSESVAVPEMEVLTVAPVSVSEIGAPTDTSGGWFVT